MNIWHLCFGARAIWPGTTHMCWPDAGAVIIASVEPWNRVNRLATRWVATCFLNCGPHERCFSCSTLWMVVGSEENRLLTPLQYIICIPLHQPASSNSSLCSLWTIYGWLCFACTSSRNQFLFLCIVCVYCPDSEPIWGSLSGPR